LRKELEVELEAVKQNGDALQYASKELNIGETIQSVITQLKNEPVSRVPEYFESLDSELKNNKLVVLAAVERHVLTLLYASVELRGDHEVVMAALRQSRSLFVLEYASNRLKGDKDFMLEAVRCHGFALYFASEELKGDRDVVLEAVRFDGNALQYASEALKGDRDVVMEAVKNDGNSLQYASEELRVDPDLLAIARR